ncbi:DUF4256 domain-containing protein [Mycoplasmopsis gallinacea]|uniref:DUF4256 domain-containing protein n=1 Tax=Mycoplasmopsis gallinacea TaxID=29556 RepID=A0A449A317_9BACT|nr:DUF4256 domain-containing protein [Mycoplasmopsis gallinacea]VEU58618.1 Uncharacterised protein [Mycoplasmopsis gallinacea]
MENKAYKLLKSLYESKIQKNLRFSWETIQKEILENKEKLDSLKAFFQIGEELELIEYEGSLFLIEMGVNSPSRRSFCYDEQARITRKKFAPENSALEWCKQNNVSLVDEKMYFFIQDLKDIDLKTSSWILTDISLRNLGGAIFGDKRYGRTFIYHNGADSYYSSRGFRTYIKLL